MLEVIKNALWSPVTVISVILVGIVILIKTRFYTLWGLPSIFRDTVFSIKRNRKAFGLMCTSLGGTIGVGNAIGVAGAIADGGAGAVFWMAAAGMLGMAVKYAEVYLSLRYRSFYGPISYIERGIGSKAFARIYAFLCIGVSFGMGNMAQVRSALTSFDGILPVPRYFIAVAISLLFVTVTIGGLDKIRSFSEITIPMISLLYLLLLSVILYSNRDRLPLAFGEILNGSGIMYGIKWAVIKKGITGGFSKAVFSSEAGLGSAGFAHSASDEEPCQQAKWGVVEVFADSLICIMTALALLTLKSEIAYIPETFMTRYMFAVSFGRIGETFYGAAILIFAFSSLLCWYYNGSCAVTYLTGKKQMQKTYCAIFAIIILLSSFVGDSIIIDLSDIANALMMTVNICALWVLVFKNSLTF